MGTKAMDDAAMGQVVRPEEQMWNELKALADRVRRIEELLDAEHTQRALYQGRREKTYPPTADATHPLPAKQTQEAAQARSEGQARREGQAL